MNLKTSTIHILVTIDKKYLNKNLKRLEYNFSFIIKNFLFLFYIIKLKSKFFIY